MALAAALAAFMALLPAGLASNDNSKSLTVTCKGEGPAEPPTVTVTAAGIVLVVVCPALWTINPPFAEAQQVCTTATCEGQKPLTKYFPEAGEKPVEVKNSAPGLTITFNELPKTEGTFYLNCKDNNTKTCSVTVNLSKSTAGPSGGDEPPKPPPSDSGTPSVQTCKQENASITLKIPEKGSTALFACGTGFDLFPKEANKVFSKDCKKEETLSDMTRTDNPAAEEATGARSEESKTYTYTLKADKKPSKKTLCYLCARHEMTAKPPGTAKDYCTIYVESGAGTQSDLIFTFILAFPCVLAAFHST